MVQSAVNHMDGINIKELFDRGEASIVLTSNGKTVYTDFERGIAPAVRLLDRHGEALKGACVYDVIIGKAAASIFVLGGAEEVHGWTMSDTGLAMLESHGIKASRDIGTDVILNRTLTGMCPFEEAVLDCATPEECLAAIMKKLDTMGIPL